MAEEAAGKRGSDGSPPAVGSNAGSAPGSTVKPDWITSAITARSVRAAASASSRLPPLTSEIGLPPS